MNLCKTADQTDAAKNDPRGKIGTIFVEVHQAMLQAKFQKCMPCGFKQKESS